MKTVFVYALHQPDLDFKVRYVGLSIEPYKRLTNHFAESRLGQVKSRKSNWLRSLHAKPIVEILWSGSWEDSRAMEAAMIEHFKESGCDLVNGTPGGDGVGSGKDNPLFGKKRDTSYVTSEFRRKQRLAHVGRKLISGTNWGGATPGRKKTNSEAKSKYQFGLKHRGASSRFRGVSWDEGRKLWASHIKIERHRFSLGRYATEEEASISFQWAYNLFFPNNI